MFAKHIRRPAVFGLCALWAAGLALAQYTTTSLSGTVVDPSGAPVSGAQITVEGVDNGLRQTGTSGDDGAFSFPALQVGRYQISVEKPGFAKYTQTGLSLSIGQPVSVQVKLQIGNISQQISVSADAELVNTESGTVGQLINNKKILDLPLDGRQPQALLFLTAGTVNTTGNYCLVNCQGGVYPGEQDGSVNGAGPRSVNFQMDGTGHNDTYINTNLPFPNPDAVAQFNVDTDNLSAQYGIGAGAVVNIITKSGTNQIHGDAFEFLRNGDLNARNFFAPTHDTLKRNQYGGAIGGPILKDKLFYFGTYQGTKIRSAAQGEVAFVPTAAQRTGDFSGSGITVTDPNTGLPFAGDRIPSNRLSAPAQNFLNYIPLPNGPDGRLTFAGANIVQNDDQYLIKINYIQGKHQISGSWFWTRFDEPPDIAIAKQNLLAADGNGNQVTVKNLALNDIYTMTPNVVFNTWFGWSSQTGGSISGSPFSFSSLGVDIAAPTPPEISMGVNGYFSINTNHDGTFNRGDYTIREDVTYQHGRNEFHFGGEAVRVSNELINTFLMSGSFTFGSSLSGNNLSDFILGDASNFNQGGGEYKNLEGVLWSLYAQDNFRVNSKLKVDFGLRWDPYFPYTEQHGRTVCYLPGTQTPSARFPNAPLGMLFPNDPNCPNGGSEPNLLNIAPRLGFAYKIGANTVLRGGGGIYFTPIANNETNGMVDTAPFSPQFNYTGVVNFANPYSTIGIPNPFPAQYASTQPQSNVQFTLPVSIYGTLQHNWHLPEIATWNINLEHQFAGSWVGRISYAGNKGTYQSTGALSFNQQNPAIYIPGQSTEANTQQRRLNPVFGSVGLLSSDNNSNYQSLRLNIEKRLNHGFTITANYTWSHMLDDESPNGSNGRTDPFDRRLDYGNSNDDVPNVFNFTSAWQIPALPVHGLTGKLINGWQVSNIISWRSGFPYSIFSNADNSLSGVGSDRTDYIGGQASLDPDRSHGQLIQEYFNTAAFVPNATGTFGNSGKNILRGPRYFNMDMAVLKNFMITERTSVQFRSEFFNLFNNVNFAIPNNYFGTTGFGQITSVLNGGQPGFPGGPRIIQFALKLLF
jgi:hypothetical protein